MGGIPEESSAHSYENLGLNPSHGGLASVVSCQRINPN